MRPAVSDSDYARQLQAGFRRLRFEPALEAQYRQQRDVLLWPRVLSISLLALVIWLGFSLFDLWRIDAAGFTAQQQATLALLRNTRVGVGAVVGLAALVGLLRAPAPAQRLTLVALALAMAWGSAYSVYAYKAMALPDEASVLVLMMLAIFLPSGLSLGTQLWVALFFIGCVLALALAAPLVAVAEAMLRATVVLMLSLAVLAFGAYWREYLLREQFLYRSDAQWLAMRDGLTGLYNRRSFTQHLERLVRQAGRDGRALALVLVDLDHFKKYNDLYGHPEGDQALRRVGQALAGMAARPLDLAARLGGEEFALLLFDSASEHARASAEELVRAVHGLAIPHRASPLADVLTASAGLALLRADETAQAFYARADQLLYQAKHSGRNRCCSDIETPRPQPRPHDPPRTQPLPKAT